MPFKTIFRRLPLVIICSALLVAQTSPQTGSVPPAQSSAQPPGTTQSNDAVVPDSGRSEQDGESQHEHEQRDRVSA